MASGHVNRAPTGRTHGCTDQQRDGGRSRRTRDTRSTENNFRHPDPKFGGVIEEKASEFEALVAAARCTAKGRAQRAAHYDG